jgi:GLPGLI family protein
MKFLKWYAAGLLLLPFGSLWAQSGTFSGEIKYQQITAFFDTTKKRLTPSVLLFRANQSLFVQGETVPLGTFVVPPKFDESTSIAVFIDLTAQSMTSSQRAIGERWVVEDTLQTLLWTIYSNETRQISKYKCLKAEAFTRGRKYTAWFTPEIPVPVGPWKLYGLPGLILEAVDSTGGVKFLLESITMPIANEKEIVPPKSKLGRRVVNEVDFVKLRQENFDKMNKMTGTFPKPEGVVRSSSKVRIGSVEIFPDE